MSSLLLYSLALGRHCSKRSTSENLLLRTRHATSFPIVAGSEWDDKIRCKYRVRFIMIIAPGKRFCWTCQTLLISCAFISSRQKLCRNPPQVPYWLTICGTSIAWSLYGVFSGPLGQCIFQWRIRDERLGDAQTISECACVGIFETFTRSTQIISINNFAREYPSLKIGTIDCQGNRSC